MPKKQKKQKPIRKMNKKPYFEFRETINLFNKLFIKEWGGGITNNINDIPKNKYVLVKVK